jgi:hypothetical protein
LLAADSRHDHSLQRGSIRMFGCDYGVLLCGNVTIADYDSVRLGIGENDAMTIPDYVVIGFLIGMMLSAAARSLGRGKFEL